MLTLGVLVAGSTFAQTAPNQDNRARTENRGAKKGHAHKAKGTRTPEERAQLRTERLSQRLELSEAQTNQLRALHLKQINENKALRGEARKQKGEARVARKTNHEKYEAELKGILTDQQFAKYQQDREEMRSKSENRSQERGRGFKGKENRGQRS